jgi:c-di-GMP-binding flagellar brake protein YcgR
MSMTAFEVGMKIFVDVPIPRVDRDGPSRASLSSVIEEIIDAETVLIQAPTYQGNYYHMSSLDAISIRFPTKTSIYSFDAKYQGTVQRGSMSFARMQRVSAYEERQLRDCFRLPCFIPTNVKRYWESERKPSSEYSIVLPDISEGNLLDKMLETVKDVDVPDAPPGEYFSGHLLDLSDGGALLATEEIITRGDKLTLEFKISFDLTVECKALRVFGSSNHNYPYSVGVSFVGLNLRNKERVYQYLISEQLKQRKR